MVELSRWTVAALGYAEAVLADRLGRRCGEGERLAAARFVADLERVGDEDFPYWYDDGEAARVCAFLESMPHVKGELRGSPLVLEPVQAFWTCNLFGWRETKTGLRRFRRAYLEMARKNAKSTWLAAVLLWLTVEDGEPGAEVYTGATSKEQAATVWQPMRQMCLLRPSWCSERTVEVRAQSILHHPSGSVAMPVIGEPGDGGNVHGSGIDEYHEHRTSAQLDTMDTGTGARRQPLRIVTTTAGLSTASPCFRLRSQMLDLLRGRFADERTFTAIYAMDAEDDWQERANWDKANPLLGVSASVETVDAAYHEALRDNAARPARLAKHGGLWGNAAAPFFDAAAVARAKKALTWDDFAQAGELAIGLDGSDREDMTSAVVVARVLGDDGAPLWLVKGRHWLPGTVIAREANAHYRDWQAGGHLQACDGAEIDRQHVEDDLAEIIEALHIPALVYDPAYMRQVAQGLETRTGVARIAWKVGAALHMSPAMFELRAAFAAGRVVLDDDPVLEWALGNVEAQPDRRGNVYPRRPADRSRKIDPAFAALCALGHFELGGEDDGAIGEPVEVIAA